MKNIIFLASLSLGLLWFCLIGKELLKDRGAEAVAGVAIAAYLAFNSKEQNND